MIGQELMIITRRGYGLVEFSMRCSSMERLGIKG